MPFGNSPSNPGRRAFINRLATGALAAGVLSPLLGARSLASEPAATVKTACSDPGLDAVALGDPVPAALQAYFDALDAGRFADAAARFAPTGVHAVPAADAIETDARIVTTGPDALRARFAARGETSWRHGVKLCVADADAALIEGVHVEPGGTETATFVCSVRFASDGRIARYLEFGCNGARDPIPTDIAMATRPADAAQVVHDYFAALDDGRFEEAAARFSSDVLYSHPPYRHTGIKDPNRIEFRGRPALEAAFGKRGKASFDHEILTTIQRGPHCLFEGAVTNLPNGRTGSFISSLSLADDGTIRRYLSFYCEPGLPRA